MVELYRAKKLFELPNYELKERYKPLWYALAKLLKDEMKDESAKMGSELEESVAEILQKVDRYKQK